jgi:hypothetical protein
MQLRNCLAAVFKRGRTINTRKVFFKHVCAGDGRNVDAQLQREVGVVSSLWRAGSCCVLHDTHPHTNTNTNTDTDTYTGVRRLHLVLGDQLFSAALNQR